MGTITDLRIAKSNINSNKKKPATIKKPAGMLFKRELTQYAKPKKMNNKKKETKIKASIPVSAPETADDVPLVIFTTDSCL
jgi:hypothetical protein